MGAPDEPLEADGEQGAEIDMPQPPDAATAHTLAFVRAAVRPGSRRLLEVGCGSGRLALALQESGLEVIAVDASARAVERAAARGVDARVCEWPDFTGGPFDAIVFSRSLHHITPLDAAVTRASELLDDGGVLVVEDFAYTDVDAGTAEWFRSTLLLLCAGRGLSPPEQSFIEAMVNSECALESWRSGHCSRMHTAAALEAALRQRFAAVTVELAPYLYRYLVTGAAGEAPSPRLVRALMEQEDRLAGQGVIRAVGRRFVASDRPS